MGEAECPVGVIAFAERPGVCRGQMAGQDEVGCVEFTEIVVKREPRADHLASEITPRRTGHDERWPTFRILSYHDHPDIYRELGWHGDAYCGSEGWCYKCEKYSYEQLPKSQLDDQGVCGYCREKEEKSDANDNSSS